MSVATLLFSLRDEAGPQFPQCLFERPVRQPAFQSPVKPNKLLLMHTNCFYDTRTHETYDTVEAWCKSLDLAPSSLQFGNAEAWIPVDELYHRATLLLAEYERRVPTFSELVHHAEHLRTRRDAATWGTTRFEDLFYVFDTDNRTRSSGVFYLEYAPRTSCKFKDGRFVDTQTQKRFQTLEGWLAICGHDAELEDVRFCCKRMGGHGFARSGTVVLTVRDLYHRLRVLLDLRKESVGIYSKCIWRYRRICKGGFDEEEWDAWGDEEDADTVWTGIE
jgi:hypothetical protein